MSMKDIARMTGLSIATVSHALNGTRSVSEQSLKLVNEAAEKIGYKPSLAAQILRTRKSGIIALVIPSSSPTNDTNSFYFGVLNGAKTALEKREYDMIVSTYPESSRNVDLRKLRVFQTKMVDGVLLVPHSNNRNSVSGIKYIKAPVVLLDRRVENSGLPSVTSDNFGASMQAVELLIKSGRKRIAFMGGKPAYSTVVERLEGYKKALEKSGIDYNEELVLTNLKDQKQEGISAAKKLISLGADAVFVENSMMIIGFVEYCQSNEIKIPDDVSIAGFDDAPWMDIVTPGITAIKQDGERIGELGAEMLMDIISGETIYEYDMVVKTELIKRGSH